MRRVIGDDKTTILDLPTSRSCVPDPKDSPLDLDAVVEHVPVNLAAIHPSSFPFFPKGWFVPSSTRLVLSVPLFISLTPQSRTWMARIHTETNESLTERLPCHLTRCRIAWKTQSHRPPPPCTLSGIVALEFSRCFSLSRS